MEDFGEFGSDFIQAPEDRSNPHPAEAEGIPVIDLSPISSQDVQNLSIQNPSAIEDLIKRVGDACREWGFFQVINHGVPLDKRQRIESTARKFFAQSLEEKRKVRRYDVKVLGYSSKERSQNVRDWKEIFDFGVEDPTLLAASADPDDNGVAHWNNQWPENPPEFKQVCQEYSEDVVKLALKLMELIALSLGLPAKRFHEYFKDQTSNFRLNRYPPCPSPELALGHGPHSDLEVLAVLAQDEVGGLQVKPRIDGEWVGVKPNPDAFIINLGNVIKVWTNGTYKSVEHRVVANSARERLSILFFLSPSHQTMVEPLEELTNKGEPPKYRGYNWGKFHVAMKAGTPN